MTTFFGLIKKLDCRKESWIGLLNVDRFLNSLRSARVLPCSL